MPPSAPLEPGSIIAGRFRLEQKVGAGGMGTVYRAADLRDARPVALKLLRAEGDHAGARLLREAKLLSAVRHPAVVGHVDHGHADDGSVYLVMEWLEGEDLASRLRRGPLELQPALGLVRRLAGGLAALHQAGIVHRDIKPANIMLPRGSIADGRLVDLGIARTSQQTQALTRTGAVLGTCGYMSPEQLKGSRDIDGRADLFSLGCVLFECLSGKPLYSGASFMAVAFRVMVEEAPRLRSVVPAISASVDELVARCLVRDRGARWPDGAALAAALGQLESPLSTVPGPATDAPVSVPSPPIPSVNLHLEQRPVALVLARSPARPAGPADDDPAPGGDATIDHLVLSALGAIGQRWDARLFALPGAAALVIEHAGSARDQAARGAEVALAIRQELEDWTLSVSTSTAATGEFARWPELLDRAVGGLEQARHDRAEIRLDRATAALLDVRFAVAETVSGPVLRGLAGVRDDARPLLGRLTPCVGREKELALLEGTLAECLEESEPRAVLIVAEAGMGKSKLRRELLARVEDRPARVLRARTETGGRLAALAVIRALLREAIGGAGESPAAFFEPLVAAGGAQPDAAQFLGELLGAAPSAPGEALRVARLDPAEMRWRVADAVQGWLRGEAARGSLLLSLEDLHEADASSVLLLAESWRTLAGQAVMLVGTARPEVETTHPALLELPGLQTVRLAPLGRKAAERLAREVLGAAPAGPVQGRRPLDRLPEILDRAEGHPLMLEELIRQAAGGADLADLPSSVLALLQCRLLTLDGEVRRVLRGASVFGERPPVAGVAALLGLPLETTHELLGSLAEQDLLQATRRPDGTLELRFRQGLVRDATYAMLPEEERIAAHRAAAAWLSSRPEPDAVAVAEQLTRAGQPDAALPWFLLAARHASAASGVEEAIALCRRAQVPGASAVTRIEGLVAELSYLHLTGRVQELMVLCRDRVPWAELEPGSEPWLTFRMVWAYQAMLGGHNDVFDEQIAQLLPQLHRPFSGELAFAWASGLVHAFGALAMAGPAQAVVGSMRRALEGQASPPLSMQGLLDVCEAYLLWQHGHASGLTRERRGNERLERVGYADRDSHQAMLAIVLADHGQFDEAVRVAGAARARARRLKNRSAEGWALAGELCGRTFRSPPEDVTALAAELPDLEDLLCVAWVNALARVATWRRSTDPAVADAVHDDLSGMLELVRWSPGVSGYLQVTLAQIELLRGQAAAALDRLDAVGNPTLAPLVVRSGLCHARLLALRALGREADYRAGLDQARARVERLRSELEPGDRAAFDHAAFIAEILALRARQ